MLQQSNALAPSLFPARSIAIRPEMLALLNCAHFEGPSFLLMTIGARKLARGDIRFALLIAVTASFWPSRPLAAAQNSDVAGSLIIEDVINTKTTNANFGLGDRIEIAITGPSVVVQRAASDPRGI